MWLTPKAKTTETVVFIVVTRVVISACLLSQLSILASRKQKLLIETSVLEPELPRPRIQNGLEEATEPNTCVEVTFLPL